MIFAVNGMAFLGLVLLTEYTNPVTRSDHALQDMMLVNWTPAEPASPPGVALVTITETTLAALPYRSPIDRNLLAQIAEACVKAGAAAIAFDILIDQQTEPAKDAALMQAIAAANDRIVIAWADHRGGLLEQQSAWLNAFVQHSGARPGFANLTTDTDGVVRRFENSLPDTDVPSLAAAALTAANPAQEFAESGRILWRLGTDGGQAFPTLPAPGLLALAKVRPQALQALLGGKIVLVGADLPLVDRHTSSLASSANPDIPDLTAGVEIHAHIIDQALRELKLENLPDTTRLVLLAALALVTSVLAISNLHYLLKVLGLICLLGCYLGLAIWALYEHLLLVPLTQPVALTIAMFALTLGGSTLFLSSDRKFIRAAFGQYISPKLVAEMIDNPDLLSVGGTRKHLSFIFTDIAGFTSLSEAITPERLTRLLNDYLGGMSELVVKHDGIVDKFIGDAVVAIFGAPGDDPHHRIKALKCALEMDRYCQEFVALNNDIEMGVTRIGVHSGEAIVGNFGGEKRYDYTAMGDTMNIAARLESANKSFGTKLAVSGNVMQGLGDMNPNLSENRAIEFEGSTLVPLGNVIFKGKKRPISVFTPLLHREDEWHSAVDRFIELMGADGSDTKAHLDNLYERHPDEPVIALHKHRFDNGERGWEMRLRDK